MLEEKRLTIAPGPHIFSVKMIKIAFFSLIPLFLFSLSRFFFEPGPTVWGFLGFVGLAFMMLPEFPRYTAFRWDKKQYAVTVNSVGVSVVDPQYHQLSLAWSEITAIENDSYMRTLKTHWEQSQQDRRPT